MTSIDHEPATSASPADQEAMRKPLDHEIDVFGLTHQGKVRKTNQDNFLVATLHRRVDVKFSSLAEPVDHISGEERLAFIMMVVLLAGCAASPLALSNAAKIALKSRYAHRVDSIYTALLIYGNLHTQKVQAPLQADS